MSQLKKLLFSRQVLYTLLMLIYSWLIYQHFKDKKRTMHDILILEDKVSKLEKEIHELKEETGYYSKDSDVVSE